MEESTLVECPRCYYIFEGNRDWICPWCLFDCNIKI